MKRESGPPTGQVTSKLIGSSVNKSGHLLVRQHAVPSYQPALACNVCSRRDVDITWYLNTNATYSPLCKECIEIVVSAQMYALQHGTYYSPDHNIMQGHATSSGTQDVESEVKGQSDTGDQSKSSTVLDDDRRHEEVMEIAFLSAAANLRHQKGVEYPPQNADSERGYYRLNWNNAAPVSDCRSEIPDAGPYAGHIEALLD